MASPGVTVCHEPLPTRSRIVVPSHETVMRTRVSYEHDAATACVVEIALLNHANTASRPFTV